MLPDAIVSEASSRGLTIACAESITGGGVAAALVTVPGASAVLAGGVVAYTVSAKVSVLGIDADVIDRFGVVSEEVALAMARRARELFDADVGVATTGVAGPAPHGDKAPGTVCVASVGPLTVAATTHVFDGDRVAVLASAVGAALDSLGEALHIRVQNA